MRRRLFEIPLPFINVDLPIFSYGVMLVLGFLLGIALARAKAKRLGIDPDVITELGLRAMIGGVVGARLFYVFENYQDYWPQIYKIVYIHEGGLVFYGGMLAVVAVLAHYFTKQKLNVWQLFDIAAPSLAVGLMFGRFGCFMNGCCYGDRCSPDLPLAVRFPKSYHGVTLEGKPKLEGSPAFLDHLHKRDHLGRRLVTEEDDWSCPVHPTQLYSSASALALFLFLNWYFPHRKRPGDVALLFFLIYPIYRFVVEWLRADNEPWFTGLTTSQNISVAMFVTALVLWVRRCKALSAEGGTSPGT